MRSCPGCPSIGRNHQPLETTASAEYNVASYPACITGFGVHDMSGGDFEWTSTATADNSAQRSLRGGMSTENPQLSARCTYRLRYTATAVTRVFSDLAWASQSSAETARSCGSR